MLKPGDTFGDYRVVRLLGKGGMGSVFLLENAEGAQVATKILDPESAGDAESRKRFLREAELALGVKHPNLVETYDVGEDPETGLCYILMEYVSGGSLADRLRGGPLSVNEAISITYQIASVLELARGKGVVHRDIKPDNIMFGADGKAKLADLGIARGGVGSVGVTTVTQTGMMIGTPAYMSPEQMLDSHNVDCRADIYSLGIVFFEMLTGERPNKDDTVVQLMAKVVAGEPIPDVRTLRPEISASVAELISLMCAMKADERVSTPAEVTLALSQIAHGREVTIRRKRPSAVPPAKRSKGVSPRLVLAILFGLAAAAGLAVFIYLGTKHASAPVPVRMQEEDPVRPVAIPDAPRPPPVHERPRPAPVSPQSVAESKPAPHASTSAPEVRKPAADQQPAAATGAPVSSEAEEHRLELERARAKLKPIAVEIAPGRRIEFVPCPAGTFTMGFRDFKGFRRLRQATITRPFWIASRPITFADWQALTGEDKYEDIRRWNEQQHEQVRGWVLTAFGERNIPIGNLGNLDVHRFMSALSARCAGALPDGYVFRAPTIAEWMHAYKCGDSLRDDVRYGHSIQSRRVADDAIAYKDKIDLLKKAGMSVSVSYNENGVPVVQFDGKENKGLTQSVLYIPVRGGMRPPNPWGIYDLMNVGTLTLDRWMTSCPLQEMRHRVKSEIWAHLLDEAQFQDMETDPLRWDDKGVDWGTFVCASHPSNRSPEHFWLSPGWNRDWNPRSGIRPVIGPDLLKERGIVPQDSPAEVRTEKGGIADRPADPAQVRERKSSVRPLPSKAFNLPRKQTIELIGCPTGSFRMGYIEDPPPKKAERAFHEVRITRPFWLGKTPVTKAQWAVLMGDVQLTSADKALGGMESPMTAVADAEIREYCQKLTRKFRSGIPKGYVFRLPTDAEWEYASRGGTDDPDDPHVRAQPLERRALVAVLPADKRVRLAKAGIGEGEIPQDWKWFVGTCEVCTKRPNGWGLYDMLGNVDERVLDTFPVENADGSFKRSPNLVQGEITYRPSETDPLHLHKGLDAIGMMRSNAADGYPGLRRFYSLEGRDRPVGFRIALGPDLEKERQSAAKRKTKKK